MGTHPPHPIQIWLHPPTHPSHRVLLLAVHYPLIANIFFSQIATEQVHKVNLIERFNREYTYPIIRELMNGLLSETSIGFFDGDARFESEVYSISSNEIIFKINYR
jgi:hypothetical protein